MYIVGVPTVNVSPGLYIAGAPTVEFESRNLYCWLTRCRMRVQECISLVCPLVNVSPGLYITSAPTVECESRNVYR